jgi:hypothetical protein
MNRAGRIAWLCILQIAQEKKQLLAPFIALYARRTDARAYPLFDLALELTKQVQRFESRSHFLPPKRE